MAEEQAELSFNRGRHFVGFVALKEGYGDDGKVHERSELLDAHREWLIHRHSKNQNFLGVKLSQVGDISYAFVDNGELLLFQEPGVEVSGEIASYSENLSDDEIHVILVSLFESLARKVGQATVRFTYFGEDNYRQSTRIRIPEVEHPLD